MEATTPELGPVGFWSPKSSSFSSSDSIVVEEAARNFLSPLPSIKHFVQLDKVDEQRKTFQLIAIQSYFKMPVSA